LIPQGADDVTMIFGGCVQLAIFDILVSSIASTSVRKWDWVLVRYGGRGVVWFGLVCSQGAEEHEVLEGGWSREILLKSLVKGLLVLLRLDDAFGQETVA